MSRVLIRLINGAAHFEAASVELRCFMECVHFEAASDAAK